MIGCESRGVKPKKQRLLKLLQFCLQKGTDAVWQLTCFRPATRLLYLRMEKGVPAREKRSAISNKSVGAAFRWRASSTSRALLG
jgi:hypothetical protein